MSNRASRSHRSSPTRFTFCKFARSHSTNARSGSGIWLSCSAQCWRISASAASGLSSRRASRSTRAPLEARTFATWRDTPAVAPVRRATCRNMSNCYDHNMKYLRELTFPCRLGTSSSEYSSLWQRPVSPSSVFIMLCRGCCPQCARERRWLRRAAEWCVRGHLPARSQCTHPDRESGCADVSGGSGRQGTPPRSSRVGRVLCRYE